MGNNNTNLLLSSNIHFVQNLDDQNFGNIQIYKSDQGKYIMMLRRTFMKNQSKKKFKKYTQPSHNSNGNKENNQGSNTSQKLTNISNSRKTNSSRRQTSNQQSEYKDYGFHEILNQLNGDCSEELQHYITPMMHTNKKIQNICIVYEVMDTYCQYFNFTLADMIKYKKQMDKQQLWLCFKWMLELAIIMKQRGWAIRENNTVPSGIHGAPSFWGPKGYTRNSTLGLKLNKIFITLKGLPTVSIHHIIKQNQHYDDQVLQLQQVSTFSSANSTNTQSSSNLQQIKPNSFISINSLNNKKTSLQQIALGILQLACMTTIGQNQNIQLYLRKVQKIDVLLSDILASILRKTISKTTNSINAKINQNLEKMKPKLDQTQVLLKITDLLTQGKITQSKQIKLNKFRYVIPKVENKPSNQAPFFQASNQTKQKQKEKPIVINNLQGRKKQSQSLKSSTKRENYQLGSNIYLNINDIDNRLSPVLSSLQTPVNVMGMSNMNKTVSIKSALLMDQIQNRKKQSEKQKQKLSERKEMIMNMNCINNEYSPSKSHHGHGTNSIKKPSKDSKPSFSKNNKSVINNHSMGASSHAKDDSKNQNKQNLLGNSIRQVRPSFNRKQSWTKKVINDHLKLKESNYA